MSREREFAERVARLAGAEVLRRYRVSGQSSVEVKGLPRDIVTEADRASEAAPGIGRASGGSPTPGPGREQ